MQTLPIVIDCGSDNCQVGFNGGEAPKEMFPSVLGYPKYQHSPHEIKEQYVGQEAYDLIGQLRLKYPVQHISNPDWNAIAKIWRQCFRILEAQPSEHPCLLTQKPLNPKANRQKTAEIMFQHFQVPTLWLGLQSTLAAYSCGKTTALVLDIGKTASHSVPVYQGYSQKSSIVKNDLGGRHLTEYMIMLLKDEAKYYSSSAEVAFIKKAKEAITHASMNFEEQLEKQHKSKEAFILPDGNQIMQGEIKFRCPEALFRPELLEKEKPVYEMVQESISLFQMGKFEKGDLYKNIILCGGTTLTTGFSDRINSELMCRVPWQTKIKIEASPKRKFLPWIGGAIISQFSTFKDICISRDEYQERGPSIVQKCVS